jgi:hypothetical protein
LAALTPTVFNTTENAISRFKPIDRDCYQDGEFELMILSLAQGMIKRIFDFIIFLVLSKRNTRIVDIAINLTFQFCRAKS